MSSNSKFKTSALAASHGAAPARRLQNSKLAKLVPLLLDWFSANARDLPWRRTRDPYAIWVSEIMLQQTQVKTVIPYWERWVRELPTIRAVADASPDRIHKLWEGLGYYTRARNLQQAAKQIVAQQDADSKSLGRRGNKSQTKRKSKTPHVVSCKFPEDFDDVLALPGIGRYTAGAICSIAFNQPTPILDGNVIRVLTRIFGLSENPKEKETNARLWKLAAALVALAKVQRWGEITGEPALARQSIATTAREDARPTKNKNCSHLNQSLMELGALVCTPRDPRCAICPVQKLCVAFREHRVNELPNLGKREAATARRFVAFVARRNGRFLVRQRPAGVVNAHLWEFPNVEILNGISDPKLAAKSALGVKPARLQPLCTVKHSITRYRITLETFVTRLKDSQTKAGGFWKTPAQLRQLAFTAAHGKILTSTFHHGPVPKSAGR
jgi:A/G-specific adenine glycosylase